MRRQGDVDCKRPGCEHAYRQHAPGGANCRRPGCDCHGFQWVALESEGGEPVGSYAEPS